MAGPRDAQWQEVREAVDKGLPKTAIEKLRPIEEAALKGQAYAEAVKAMTWRIALEGSIQGNRAEEKIIRLEAELAKAPAGTAPLLETILAHWQWQYFQQNRWRFLQRSATAAAPGKDFTTWDLPRLFAEIDRHFTLALANADSLKKQPIAAWNDLIEKGTMPDAYRPSLYDFLANEALTFYASGEQAATKVQDAFELLATSPIFGSVTEFLAWQPGTADTNSPALKAIRLHQELIRFHQRDADPSALCAADLARLNYGNNLAAGETKVSRYQAALQAFATQWSAQEISALARQYWAQSLQQEENLVQAREVALAGQKAFPDSPGGKMCDNLVKSIEAPAFSISTERVWNAPWPNIAVQYKNLTNLHFRVVASDWSLFLAKNHRRPENLNDQERKDLLAKTPTKSWTMPLPVTTNYQERVEEAQVPSDLKPGFYFLIASAREDFAENNNQVFYVDVWVSELALIMRPYQNKLEGFVLQANSGEPVAGADVTAWRLNRNGERVAAAPAKTDANGFFSTAPGPNAGYLVRARFQGQEIATSREFYINNERQGEFDKNRVVFFTDRAIYRPGQTIQYKGIWLTADPQRDQYNVVSNREIKVQFRDANQQVIARATHRVNDYGSFNGSFTAPNSGLMGTMAILAEPEQWGSTAVQVEEYKRPKFQVTLEAPKTAAKLGDKAVVTGKVESYTGAPVDGATVKYRVVRQVHWPIWRGWFHIWPPMHNESQEIAHGTLRAGVDGAFKVEFTALPDPKVAEKDEPYFSFAVYTDATDSAGETRSAERSIQVGFTALKADLSTEEWLTEGQPVALQINTTTLDGEPQTATGAVRIHRLKAPAQVRRAKLNQHFHNPTPQDEMPREIDLTDPTQWELGEVALEKTFATDAKGKASLELPLSAGVYRAVLETQDRFGKKVTSQYPLMVLKTDATQFNVKIPHLLVAKSWSVEPGEEFLAVWGTGYDAGRAFVEIERKGKMISAYWTKPGQTQQAIQQAVTEEMRGGFTLRVTQVRENRAYFETRTVDVPWSNKDLTIKWEHFVSKLEPGQKETLTAVITGSDAHKAAAEVVATLYDASLDAFSPLYWPRQFDFFRREGSWRETVFGNEQESFRYLQGANWGPNLVGVDISYRHFPGDLIGGVWRGMRGDILTFSGRPRLKSARYGLADAEPEMLAAKMPAPASAPMAESSGIIAGANLYSFSGMAADANQLAIASPGAGGAGANAGAPQVDLNQVTARKNLNETAFFFPQLTTDAEGAVRMAFTMPEALTQWRFMGFAHDAQCRAGYLEDELVTAKDLMVQPNAPRFLREGDEIEIAVKVSNQSAAGQSGKVRLTFTDAQTGQSVDAFLGNRTPEMAFDVPSKESRSYSWRIQVPDGCGFLTYKAVASAGRVSDGEEGYLPVLSRRVLVTESLPLPIRDVGTRKFTFTKLVQSANSKSIRNLGLTVQMVSNPAWYAVMALPYLMEYPHECSEQTFNRLYANALARSIANGDPKIRRVFDQWKGTPALDSPLMKNQDLKSVMIEETPWLRNAQRESEARRNVGVLFDANRLDSELTSATRKLEQMQLPDGLWPWFPEGRGNEFISLYIVCGYGRLRHLGASQDVNMALRAIPRLDAWMNGRYGDILKMPKPYEYVPGSLDALYLYARSFYLKDQPIGAPHKAMVEFFLGQARKYWVKNDARMSQGHLALALKRWGGEKNLAAAAAIMRSLKERSVNDPELGMFWRDTEFSWWWYRAPIECQALMIEAFDEVANDTRAVEDCRVWLLKQKQTQDWKTTKATADAVYALLLRGRDILASDRLVEVSLGGKPVRPEPTRDPAQPAVEAGTGFYEKQYTGAEVKATMGEITVKKTDPGVAWGSVHWQYLEDVAKVTPHTGTPLKLKKSLYVKANTAKGPVIEAVKGALHPGDELVVRIELRTDRDMEFVHLKDQRGSGVEPVNVISRYKYQDGLAYYESTRDTASHFFIEYLPKGTYVFEYSARVQQRGQYQSGLATIQCLYAPEFNSHSESIGMVVK